MDEIDLKELFIYFKNRFYIIVIFTALFLLVGFFYSEFYKVPMYQSYTTILLTKESESTSITTTDINLNKSLVDSYSEIIKSRSVLGKVITNLELNYSYEELKDLVSVESINDTEIIKVTVSNKNANNAKTITDEIASVFTDRVVKLYNIENLGVIDSAVKAKNPYNINLLKDMVIFTLVGLLLSCFFIFVLFYFDTTIKTVSDVEKLGLPIVGTIPLVGGKKHVK